MNTLKYKYFAEEFKKLTNIDLLQYKEDQMSRRVENFMKKRNFKNTDQLIMTLKKDKNLLEALKSEITINVTEFLRNEKLWNDFRVMAIPEVSKGKRKIKVWSAACSSGEEPYTIAILFQEFFPRLDVEIIATDLDVEVLEKAKAGVYSKRDLLSLDPDMVQKYFEDIDEKSVKIKDSIRKKVTFQQHNLLRDPYPASLDVIVCRNVLIYFKEEAKSEIYEKFVRSLNPGGIIFIGATEQIFKPKEYGLNLMKSFFYQKG